MTGRSSRPIFSKATVNARTIVAFPASPSRSRRSRPLASPKLRHVSTHRSCASILPGCRSGTPRGASANLCTVTRRSSKRTAGGFSARIWLGRMPMRSSTYLASPFRSEWYTARRIGEPVYGYKTLVEEDSGRILGAHLVGPHADEVINLFGLAIRHNLTADDLKTTMFAYPTGASDIGYML